ncbi:CDP-glucose 4,6-dehydratase [Larkinella humicola]|uniref:CDP-glucose 4,6-dehydratase n=1 Tax=Larkinella humicola TaxID=2607654 RepID=A0A5N1JHM9_9BACT|nr:CDP-glucose 4,6-dehydratase [Larkinella humicola]KAA9353997.1 CDP-glucose 4,6-dehydratase [Larkinella humicola]
MTTLFAGIYQNKTVLITGNTGFKGSWLAYWLHQMGAKVVGYALPAPTTPNHWGLLDLPVPHQTGDIRHLDSLRQTFDRYQPEVVFHLAAQSLVRYSYQHPLETIETNIVGTAHVLECARQSASVRAVVVVTSDKCYDNPEDGKPLVETGPMGGYDPYSMSKGCAELVTASYRNSFFNVNQFGKTHQVLVASARAGNVIGGGDWADDRLIPDLIKTTQSGQPVVIRNPEAVRPWQHVLEPLSGYLLLGQRLLEGNTSAAGGWNFGPLLSDVLPVREMVRQAREQWDAISYQELPAETNPHEAHFLSLDCTKAAQQLAWRPVWDTETALLYTINWYKTYTKSQQISTYSDLAAYVQRATEANSIWAV